MALWLCFNGECEGFMRRFEADENLCPLCDANSGEAVVTIHYLFPDKGGVIRTGIGRRSVACDPGAKRLPKHATGSRADVTCAACRASEIYARHDAENVSTHVPLIERKVADQLKGGNT